MITSTSAPYSLKGSGQHSCHWSPHEVRGLPACRIQSFCGIFPYPPIPRTPSQTPNDTSRPKVDEYESPRDQIVVVIRSECFDFKLKTFARFGVNCNRVRQFSFLTENESKVYLTYIPSFSSVYPEGPEDPPSVVHPVTQVPSVRCLL